ncbi:MAG: hypothetical protein IH994_05685 [Proteobacteria bacterium]|nr:hypothetical protein [Pseudomonadota bacterium]
MTKIPLSLNPDSDPDPDPGSESEPDPDSSRSLDIKAFPRRTRRPERKPLMGWAAVGFGLLGIFTNGAIFVPLGFLCSVVALFMGQATWAFVGFLLAVIGLLTSPVLLALLGMAALAAYFGLPF